MRKIQVIAGFFVALTFLSCFNSSVNSNKTPRQITGSLFVEGCPVPGKSTAKLVTNPYFMVDGPDGLGQAGDYLLMNERAAFVIQGFTHNVNTYLYYAGTPVDAAPLSGCAQAAPEQFQEMALMVGNVDLNDITQGIYDNMFLRTFKGEWAEIISDGSDGSPAIVRVHGEDDIFWLTEMVLVQELGVPLSQPQKLDIYVDYILEPDSTVLQIEYNIRNKSLANKPVLAGAALFFGNTVVPDWDLKKTPGQTLCLPPGVNIGGISGCIETDLMWMVASQGDGAWAFSMKDASMATLRISGVDAVLNGNQLLAPITIPVGGTAMVKYYLSVGETDHDSALVDLQNYVPAPVRGMTYTRHSFQGYTYDLATGDPIPNAYVEVQVTDSVGAFIYLTSFYSDANGRFSGSIPRLDISCVPGPCPAYQVVASVPGRPSPAPVQFEPSFISSLDIGFADGGVLSYDVKDESGRNIPVKVQLYTPGTSNILYRIHTATGLGTENIVPGNYDVSVTRGIEYSTYQGNIDIIANQTTSLQVTLQRPIDTAGYLSTDTHMHAGPSGDNWISIPERIRTIAAEGLDVAVSTDHEAVVSWQPGIDQTGLNPWVGYVLGEEISPAIPGHHNMFPVVERYDLNKRGGMIEWWKSVKAPGYHMDVQELHAAARARGAAIVQANHARDSGMFNIAQYNRLTGQADRPPADMGLPPQTAVMWDWDFDAFELQNGGKDVFLDPANPNESGTFEDWMSFLNLGHPKTAMGVSDAHNYEKPGYPRDFFPSSTDDPGAFNKDDLVQAILSGKNVVSTGAFARVDINGVAGMGEVVSDSDGAVDLNIHIEAIPEIDVQGFIVFVNCDEAASVYATAPNSVVKYDGTAPLSITEDSHVVVLGFGVNPLPRGLEQFNNSVPRFVTNAIFVDYDGGGYTPPGAKTCAAPTLPFDPVAKWP